MANTTFQSGTIIESEWLNDVNGITYTILGDGTNAPATKAAARTNLEVPKTDGTGATGTWPVNISGSAVTAVTQAPNDNSTNIATTAYVDNATGTSGSITEPGGRLTLASGTPVLDQATDYSTTTLYYAPYAGDKVPVFNGTSWSQYTFTSSATDTVGLSMTASWAANSQFDIFITLVGGVPVLCTGPAWPSSTLADRTLGKHRGIWVNTSSMTATFSGGSTATVNAYEATWVGSINVGSTIGTLTATFTLGQNRRCDVWNVYNQEEIVLGVGALPTAPATSISWQPSNQYPAWQAYNNDTNNRGYYFTGLPQNIDIEYHQRAFVDSLNFGVCAAIIVICIDTITSTSNRGISATFSFDDTNTASSVTLLAKHNARSSIGTHIAYMCGANANGTDGVTMWSLTTDPSRYEGEAQTMWIKYMG